MTTTPTTRKRRGRPTVPAAKARRHPVSVSFTAAEFEELKRLAAKQPLSAYLREKGLGLA